MHKEDMIYGYARVSTDAQDLTNQVAPAQGRGVRDNLSREDQRRDRRAAATQEADGQARRRRRAGDPGR